MTDDKLVVMGFGGHARSVADLALSCGYSRLIFVDKNAMPGECFLGHPVVPVLEDQDGLWHQAFAASGDGVLRKEQCETIENMGLSLVSLISPFASVGVGSVISPGCFIGHHAHVGPMAVIAKGCIVNTGAAVEHESKLGEYAHASVNSTIAGRSELGAYSMLGAGATLIECLSVCNDVMIGAGSVVIKSISSPGTYVGVPARKCE